MINPVVLRNRLRSILNPIIATLALACSGNVSVPDSALLRIRVGSFTFVSLASVMTHIIQEKGFDREYGLEVEVVPYGSVAAYYAGLTSGEVGTIAGGPLVFQKMRLQGVPVQITNTYASMASLVVLSVPLWDG